MDINSILNLDIGIKTSAITESEIHGKPPCPPAQTSNMHQGPTASKKEIPADVYNKALADLKKSFNESIDLLSGVGSVKDVNADNNEIVESTEEDDDDILSAEI